MGFQCKYLQQYLFNFSLECDENFTVHYHSDKCQKESQEFFTWKIWHMLFDFLSDTKGKFEIKWKVPNK